MHKNNYGEDIPDTCCGGWRYISKENAHKLAELYFEEMGRDEGDIKHDLPIICEEIRKLRVAEEQRNENFDAFWGL